MQILVTGGAGFTGSRPRERLIDSGDEVIRLDNFLTGCRTGSRDNIGHLLDCTRFELIRCDVSEPIPSSVRYCPLPQHDSPQRCPDITRAQVLPDRSPRWIPRGPSAHHRGLSGAIHDSAEGGRRATSNRKACAGET